MNELSAMRETVFQAPCHPRKCTFSLCSGVSRYAGELYIGCAPSLCQFLFQKASMSYCPFHTFTMNPRDITIAVDIIASKATTGSTDLNAIASTASRKYSSCELDLWLSRVNAPNRAAGTRNHMLPSSSMETPSM